MLVSLNCTSQDSIYYKGMKMTTLEADTLKNMTEKSTFPEVISFLSNGCCVFKNDDFLCSDLVCLPESTKVYVCRKSGDKYLCLTYGHIVFVDYKDINTPYDVDKLLDVQSNIYNKFRLHNADYGNKKDNLDRLNKLIGFMQNKSIVVLDDDSFDDDLGMKGFSFELLNNSKKTIKNAWVSFIGYDEKDRPVRGISNRILITKRIDSPIRKDCSLKFSYDGIWDTDLFCFSMIESIKVQYMDNSIKNYPKAWLYCLNNELKHACETLNRLNDFMK